MINKVELKLDSPEAQQRTLHAIAEAFLLPHQVFMLDCRGHREDHNLFLGFMKKLRELLKNHPEWRVSETSPKGYIGLIRKTRNTVKVSPQSSRKKAYVH